MDFPFNPLGSSPPSFDDYSPQSPPTSQGRPDRDFTSTAEDHKFKRRRLDEHPHSSHHLAESANRSNTSHLTRGFPPAASNPYPQGSLSLPRESFTTFMSDEVAFFDEPSALSYLASSNGFSRDLMAHQPFTSLHSHSIDPSPSQHSIPIDLPNQHMSNSPIRSPRSAPSVPIYQRSMPPEIFGQPPSVTSEGRPGNQSHSVTAVPHPDREASHPPFDYRNYRPYMSLATEHLMPRRPPPHSTQSVPSSQASSVPEIKLVLSRATQESIDLLMEHKRECPACQLEFEVDNFVARVTCCDTSIHVACLSAWVNSATYAKSKACMKCRRTIDARRSLNSIIPPISDDLWDKGVDFNVPQHVKLEQDLTFNINGRPDRSAIRRMRASAWARYGSRQGSTGERVPSLSAETRQSIYALRREQAAEQEDKTRRFQAAQAEVTRAMEADRIASTNLMDGQLQLGRGQSIDLMPLMRKCEETGRARTAAHAEFSALQKDIETTITTHAHRLQLVMQEAMMKALRESRSRATAESVPPATTTNPGEPSRSFSSSSSDGD